MAMAFVAERPDIELNSGEQLYLLLDGARIPALERALFEQDPSPSYQPIYLHAPWDSLREVSPCLVCATPNLLDWFMQNRDASWGYLLSSPLSLLSLAERLRGLIEVESPYGSRILLKLAMPETMWRLFMDDEPWLWQGVAQVWIPTRQGEGQVWQHKVAAPGMGSPWGAPATFRRAVVPSGRGELVEHPRWDKSTHAHLVWARMLTLPEPMAWIAHWADYAYAQGFESERDLLLFSM
ncbi:DUF4123 domain-containing protein [Aeromonas caviae]